MLYNPPVHQPQRDSMCEHYISELGESLALMLGFIFDCRSVFERTAFHQVKSFLGQVPDDHYKLQTAIESYLMPLSKTEDHDRAVFWVCAGSPEKQIDIIKQIDQGLAGKRAGCIWPVAQRAVSEMTKKMQARKASFHEYNSSFTSGVFRYLERYQVRILYPDYFQAMLEAVSHENELDLMIYLCQSDQDEVTALRAWYHAQFSVLYDRRYQSASNEEIPHVKKNINDIVFSDNDTVLAEAENKKRDELRKVILSVNDFKTLYKNLLMYLFLDKNVRAHEYLSKKD